MRATSASAFHDRVRPGVVARHDPSDTVRPIDHDGRPAARCSRLVTTTVTVSIHDHDLLRPAATAWGALA
jgi:hypothetical protein